MPSFAFDPPLQKKKGLKKSNLPPNQPPSNLSNKSAKCPEKKSKGKALLFSATKPEWVCPGCVCVAFRKKKSREVARGGEGRVGLGCVTIARVREREGGFDFVLD